jgi:YD repeat-containing protein
MPTGQEPAGMPVRQVILLAVLAILVIFFLRMFVISPAPKKAMAPTPRPAPTPVRVAVPPRPVEHGAVVQPQELQAHGKLYFVAMGKQVISAESLAAYYRHKFNIGITVLPRLPLTPEACVPSRNQCIAEEMTIAAERAYSQIAHKPDSVIIVLTDEDIFPRRLEWDFTYSLITSVHAGIVSTRRMDPASWGDQPNYAVTVARTRQMLTKYIARLYFHLPISYDPTSVMYQPLIPDGGSDDLYESDLHSEESANGLRGEDWPCLSFKYSYSTRQLTLSNPETTGCYQMPRVYSTDEETFTLSLSDGLFVQRAMDFQMDSVPAIDFGRAYEAQFILPWAFGQGATHRYDTRLSSDGASKLTYMEIIREDGDREYLYRVSPGIGFSTSVVFESRNDGEEIYGARMTWDSGHFKLQFRDGAWSTYLPCADGRCYWIGYQDAQGHSLRFDRDPYRALQRLTASDGQGVEMQSDALHRVVAATDTKGHHVSYEYDSAGCLARVHRADGRITIYSYDAARHMIGISVAEQEGATPNVVLTNRYDDRERVTKQILADGSTYQIQYGPEVGGHVGSATLVDREGQTFKFLLHENGFTERASHIRFPVISRSSSTD